MWGKGLFLPSHLSIAPAKPCSVTTNLLSDKPWAAGLLLHVFDIHLSSSMPLLQHKKLELSHIWLLNALVLGPAMNFVSVSSSCITMFCTGSVAITCVFYCKWIYLTFQVQELLVFSAVKTLQSQWGFSVPSCGETAPPINFYPFPTPYWTPLATRDQEMLW